MGVSCGWGESRGRGPPVLSAGPRRPVQGCRVSRTTDRSDSVSPPPVTLAMENLHWVDLVGSFGSWITWPRRARPGSLCSSSEQLEAGTSEPGCDASSLTSSWQAAGTIVVLAPLDEESVAQVVQQVFGRLPRASPGRGGRGCGRESVDEREFLSSLEQEGAIEVNDGRAELRVRALSALSLPPHHPRAAPARCHRRWGRYECPPCWVDILRKRIWRSFWGGEPDAPRANR